MKRLGPRPRRARGLTTIELMISITISLIVLGAMAYIYVGSRGAYRSNEALARVQEAGRFALEWMTRDLRMTGFIGCQSRGNLTPVVLANPPGAFAGQAQALVAYEDGAGWTNPTTVPRVRGDVVTLRAAVAGADVVDPTDVTAATVKVYNNCAGFRQGDYALLATCDRASVIRVTNNPAVSSVATCRANAADNVTIVHGASANGNNGMVSGSTSHQINPAYLPTDRPTLWRLQEITYFVGANPAGRPGLYRWSLGDGAEEVAENIEDLDVLYGEDTNGDGAADVYRRGDAVSNWANVTSVRLSVLVVSGETAATTGAQTVLFRDTDGDGLPDPHTAADRRLRQVFSATVAVRNRLL